MKLSIDAKVYLVCGLMVLAGFSGGFALAYRDFTTRESCRSMGGVPVKGACLKPEAVLK